jgi:type 1 glutamine amidotransferase
MDISKQVKSMRILVLCDDYWHPARILRNGLSNLEEFGFEFDWIENANEWSIQRMAEYSVILLAKANNVSSTDETAWMSEEIQQAFFNYVQRGNGLVVLHSGTAGYEQAGVLRGLIGGVFKEHPEQCPVTIEPRAGHLLTEGSRPFSVTDEHYFMDIVDDQIDIFLTTTSAHGTQPGGWTRIEGQGRVCVMTPGHNLEVWLQSSYQILITNALRWCGERKISHGLDLPFASFG